MGNYIFFSIYFVILYLILKNIHTFNMRCKISKAICKYRIANRIHYNYHIDYDCMEPYSKTLLGEFNLSSAEIQEIGLKLDYKEFDNYSRVIISNSYDENKCVKLNWNADNLRIDETNEHILSYQYDSNNNINEIKFNINKKDSISLIFYKTDFTKEYDYQEFSLIETNNC